MSNKSAYVVVLLISGQFHLGEFQGVEISHPVPPAHFVSIASVVTAQVQAIQIGIVTVTVPPGAVMIDGTIVGPDVVVLVFRAKLVPALFAHGVPCK